jgi:hypothetical protein
MNDINWENRFGNPPEKWTQQEFKMAVISTLNSLNISSKLTAVSLEVLAKTVTLLPCSKHEETILELKDCIKQKSELRTSLAIENVRGKFSIRTAVMNGIFIIIGAAITILMNYLLSGKP